MQSVGDMARALVLRTNQVRLRAEMDELAVEVSTGLVRDKARHLGGDTSGLLAIDRSLERLEAFRVSTAEASLLSATMQTAMDEIQTRSETLSLSLISAELTQSPELLTTLSQDALDAMSQTLAGLNKTVAGRYLFSGTATDQPAVLGIDDMMAALRTAVAGQTTVAGIDTELDTFFGAGGVFETTIYQGSATDLAPLQVSETESVNIGIRADNDVFREMLKPMAKAALALDGSLALDPQVQIEMLSEAGSEVLGAQAAVVELRASLGAAEARIENTSARIEAERTATSLAKLELIEADAYDTASRYENVRGQLESLYAITARSQRLSLAEYL